MVTGDGEVKNKGAVVVTPNLGNSLESGDGVLGLGLVGPLDSKPPFTKVVSLVTGKVGAGVVNKGAPEIKIFIGHFFSFTYISLPVDTTEEKEESVFGSNLSWADLSD